MTRRAIRKTDPGTIILHWALFILLIISVLTGLRIAIGSLYDMLWLRVAVLDHSQTRHTRHIRPIHIKVEKCEKIAQCLSITRDSLQNGATSF